MERKEFTKPVHVTTWMAVFLALVAVLAAVLVPQLKHAFVALRCDHADHFRHGELFGDFNLMQQHVPATSCQRRSGSQHAVN